MHSRNILLTAGLFFFSLVSSAQYSSATISPELKENANIVVRLQEDDIQVKSKGSAVIRNHYVYTVLNSGGDKYAEFVTHYDKLRKIVSVDGNLYDANGIKIRSIKKGEIKDYSNTSENDLADDSRIKHHSFSHRIYPYTIEYESVVEYDGIFYLPAWIPVFSENISVEKSILKVTAPSDYQLRYKAYNYKNEPVISRIKDNSEYNWEISQYTAVKKEVYSPSWHEITPSVLLAPSAFEMQRYEGTMNSWQEFGTFMYKLNAGRDQLPSGIKQKVHQLTDGLTDNRQKINTLYKYLQQNTRYISIQLGIGGWQTLDAGFVAGNGYGDCKALTNYMYALLKEAGIKSYPALISAGSSEDPLISDFTSNQFNHVILCVPQVKDSIWLECTSQSAQPGYLGSFTGNRQALLVDEKASALVWTPAYSAKDNIQVRNIKAVINEEGLLQANVETRYSAIQQDDLDILLKMSSKDQLAEHMRNKFDLSSYEVENFSHEKDKQTLPAIQEKVSLKVKNFASVSGKRLFINPNILSVTSFKIKDAANRKFDFDIKLSFTDLDSVVIDIPAGYKPESVPKDVNISLPSAQYRSSIKLDQGKIIYTRFYMQSVTRIPVSKTAEVTDFFDKKYKSDHSRIVFVKETP